jgi:hypothetical protein
MTNLGYVNRPPGLLHVYPDIQNETEKAKDMLDSMVSFSISTSPDLVLFTGDLTNNKTPSEWSFVQYEVARLNAAGVKWIIVPGNHDSNPDRSTLMNNYLSAGAWVTGLRDTGRLENSYSLVTLGGRQCLVICLEFGPRTAVVSWANSIVAANPGAWTILLTHAYLYRDGTRYDWATYGPAQLYNPHSPDYQWTPAEGISDGAELWSNLVSLHSNIGLVLSGHDVDVVVGSANNNRSDSRLGTTCLQLMTNYQEIGVPKTGEGILCEVFLDFVNSRLYRRTYSPYRKNVYSSPTENFYLNM